MKHVCFRRYNNLSLISLGLAKNDADSNQTQAASENSVAVISASRIVTHPMWCKAQKAELIKIAVEK